MSRYRVVVAPRARGQIKAIDDWWRVNRETSPEVFVAELEHAVSRLRIVPSIGHPHPSRPGVRKLLLPRSQYHVYYEIHSDAEEVQVLAVWYTGRGSEPELD